jgi:hypothetical protein
MALPTEPIGSIPRPKELIDALTSGTASPAELDALFEDAVRDTIARFEETGSPVITDGELRHLPDPGPRSARRRRRHDPVRGRPHAPAADPHGRAIPVRDPRRRVP